MGNIEKFNQMANKYDTPERIQMATIIADTIRGQLEDSKGKKAIDYGCGTGLVGMQLRNDFQSILFIDASSNMIEQVQEKVSQLKVKNATTLCCDFTSQYPNELHADYIMMAQTLLHIKEVRLVLLSLHKMLNKGGHLLIVDFDKNESIVSDDVHNGFEQEKLLELIKEIGFTKASSRIFYQGKKIFMNKDASLFILDATK